MRQVKLLPYYLSLLGLLVEVLVSFLQVKKDLFSTFRRQSSRDSVVDASQKLPEQRLQLHLIFIWQLRHCCSWAVESNRLGWLEFSGLKLHNRAWLDLAIQWQRYFMSIMYITPFVSEDGLTCKSKKSTMVINNINSVSFPYRWQP